MSDKMRWVYGETNRVVAAVDSGTVIEIGDMVIQEPSRERRGEKATYPMSAIPGKACKTTLELAAMHFLGVAMQRSRSGNTDPIRVATTGVFEFDCVGVRCELGDLFGPAEAFCEECPDGLLNQAVELVTDVRYAIGRAARRSAVFATSVLVDIRSTVMTGGVRGMV